MRTVMRPLSIESELRLEFAVGFRGSRPPGTLLKIPAIGIRDGISAIVEAKLGKWKALSLRNLSHTDSGKEKARW